MESSPGSLSRPVCGCIGETSGVKGCRMGRSDKVSLWYVALLIDTRFRFFILE